MDLRTQMRQRELLQQLQRIIEGQEEFDEGKLFWHIEGFFRIWDKTRRLNLVVYERESHPNHKGNMKARRSIVSRKLKKLAKKYGVKIIIRRIYYEVGNARSDFLEERKVLKKAIAFARKNDCVIVAVSVDRFFRPDNFSVKTPFVPLLVRDGERLEAMLDDVVVATIVTPGFGKRRLKGIYSKWGQKAKGRKGGRPPKKMSLKERREIYMPIAQKLRQEGMSYNEICKKIILPDGSSIPKSTIVRWVKHIVVEE